MEWKPFRNVSGQPSNLSGFNEVGTGYAANVNYKINGNLAARAFFAQCPTDGSYLVGHVWIIDHLEDGTPLAEPHSSGSHYYAVGSTNHRMISETMAGGRYLHNGVDDITLSRKQGIRLQLACRDLQRTQPSLSTSLDACIDAIQNAIEEE